MANIYDKSSLVLIPSGTKTSKVYSQKPVNGDGDFTFSRSTAATRVNADGNIEKQTGNYILYSQQIDNGYWNKYQMSVTANQATAPDGTTTADLIDDGTASAIHAIEENETIGFGGSVTASIHAKYVDTQYLVLAIYDTTYKAVAFDIQNGTIGNKSLSSLIATIEDLGSGWYRCAVTHPTNTRNNPFYTIGLRDDNVAAFYTLAGSNRQAYVWGAQLEDGLVARDYIETTTAAVEGGITDNVPRLDYTDSSCPALLLEPQRTNLVTQSEAITLSTTNVGYTASENDTTSPEGVVNGGKILETTGITHLVQKQFSVASTTASYAVSFFVKGIGRTKGDIRYGISGVPYNEIYATFNLAEETITDAVASGTGAVAGESDIIPMGNDWYRVTLTGVVGVTGTHYVRLFGRDDSGNTSYTGDVTKGFNVYGFQAEANASYATSYIPTYGTSVTRNVDNSVVTSATDLIGQTEGTFFVDAKVTLNGRLMYLGQAGNFIETLTKSNGQVNAFVRTSATQADILSSTTFATGDTIKLAFAYAQNDFVLYINGVQEGSDTNGVVPSNMAGIIMNNYSVAGYASSNYYNQALLFKTRLSNEELAALTTI